MPFAPDDSMPRVQRALDAELARLHRPQPALAALPAIPLRPPPDGKQPLRLAVVAADAGNLELRLHPLRIGLVRVATSDRDGLFGESFVPLSLSVDEQLRWVFDEAALRPLRDAAVRCGLDPGTPAHWLPRDVASQYSLHFLRELLEWLLLVHVTATAAPGTLLLRDGLLRSVAIPTVAFAALCRTLRDLTTRRRIWLLALAKRAPGGTDFLHYLDVALGAALPEAPAAHEVLPAIEQAFSPSAFASMRGRRAGRLFLCTTSRSRRGRALAIQVPVWQHGDSGWLVACLCQRGQGGFPEPGYPPELLAAHQHARIAPIEREALSRTFLRRLAAERPELQERLLASHLTGQGLVLDPQSPEGGAV